MTNKATPTYAELQQAAIDKLVEGGKYDKATAHVTFGAESVTMQEGITQESLRKHAEFVNNLGGQVEVATAAIARKAHGENDKIERIDGGLAFGGVDFFSQHDLQQKIGDDTVYGQSVTQITHQYTTEQSAWLDETRTQLAEQAKKLFD